MILVCLYASYQRRQKCYLLALSCSRNWRLERWNALDKKQAQLLPCTVVLYVNGGTIQPAGCLVTRCQIKWLLKAVFLGQWPHPCEVMRGNVSLCIIPPLDEQEICMILIFLTNVIIIEKHTFLSESENLLPWMKKCHDKISPTHYHYSNIPHFIGAIRGVSEKACLEKRPE